jgi:hypothetical protein
MDYPINTVCVDAVARQVDPRVVEAVNAGQAYFSEPDLDMTHQQI